MMVSKEISGHQHLNLFLNNPHVSLVLTVFVYWNISQVAKLLWEEAVFNFVCTEKLKGQLAGT